VHRLVIQQIAKAVDAAGKADVDRLVDLVSGAYEEFDRDRRRTDRSMSLMIDEIDTTNRSLERLVEERTRELRARESELRTQNVHFEIALANMTQGLILHDSSGRVIVCNQRYIEMYGLSPDVVTPGCSFYDLIGHREATGSFKGDVAAHCLAILRKVALGEFTQTLLKTTDGRSIQIANRPLADGGWVSTHEDITERRRSDEQIAHLAHYDLLTDLPNRALFRGQLERALEGVQRGERIAVLYIDIDEFKSVNDTLGHAVGDELLKAVANRLRGCIGKSDVVARLGGDEFAIIQAGVTGRAEVTDLVTRIYEAIRIPHECAGHLLTTDASIGIALAPDDGADLNELLKNADLAMYGAKADGRRTYRFFEPSMDAHVKAQRALEAELRKAIVAGDFEIHYQPLVNLRDNAVTGCEALLRWRHGELGPISPAQFIPVAEDTGLINELGEWVLNTACAEAAKWPDHIKIAVNVSPVQFRNQTLALKVAAALAASGLAANRLELEITEAVLMRDDEAALVMLHELKRLGVRIALDDFGTGYSSLSYLQRFPFDKIKIDRCFIKDIADSGGSSAIVQAVVDIGAARNMTTTAEGVETEAQREILRALDCTEMQGYLFSAAVPATEISRLLRSEPESLTAAPARRRRGAR
jgi:diguanylate cyclase (GGDEF)-like protein